MSPERLRRIRLLLAVFLAGLVFSGLTAFPLLSEVELLRRFVGSAWIERVHAGLVETSERHGFLFYGTDWLAFAHLVIALAFIGPWRDPVRNRWVIRWGLLCCVLVLPLALIAGAVRGIPFWWRLIDCSFGVFGFVPLWLADRELVDESALAGK